MSDNIIQLNEDLIKHDLKDLVRSSVEETLNALLDKEADELVNAQKNERSSRRQGYRSRHYKRNFQTTAREVELNVPKLSEIKLSSAAQKVQEGIEETLTYMDFPFQHWTRIRTNNTIERLNREIKRRTKAIGMFPDGQSALMLVWRWPARYKASF